MMKWKAIGQSVIGTSHMQSGKACEDAVNYTIVQRPQQQDVLVCCASDGAGSAKYAQQASAFITGEITAKLTEMAVAGEEVDETALLTLFEGVYDAFVQMAANANEPLNEFSCTVLGAMVYPEKAVFFQTGDGAIIRDDGSGSYVPVWWPHNGEYSNTTSFFIDDASFSNLKILVLHQPVTEVGIFTDGLQLLALNNEAMNVHQPFFTGMFKWLRKTVAEEDIAILNKKLREYLAGELINSRTDDDKTLFIATKLSL